MLSNENTFYEALENIFIGAPIEGEGGYVNLLNVKQKYYSKVIEIFKDNVKKDEVVDDSFKEDFYNLLYTFFEKYFSECGSVYFVKTANWQRVYEKVYSDNKDVVLFWKTHMLYYVKTDILFQSVYIKTKESEEDDEFVFYFDVGELEQKQNNEKKELVFAYKETKEGKVEGVHTENTGDNTFVLTVKYSSHGSKTKYDELRRKTGISENIIRKAIDSFRKQTSVDFFINKNAKSFLNEQLDIFLHQILLEDATVFEQSRLNQIKCVKRHAKDLISFISQFENELVRIWTKPKFVKESNYVITIDRLNEDLINAIVNHSGITEQLDEWKRLGMIEDGFELESIDNQTRLPIDTKFFKDIEIDILSCFSDIDEALDGVLVHSENFQALNTLKSKYKNRIKCIYIDPPFNTGSDFIYMDEYQDSSWLSIMSDRIELARDYLKDDGCMFLHLDHYAEHRGRELMDLKFEKQNFINNIAWAYRSGGNSKSTMLPYKHDSILFYANDINKFVLNGITERQYYNHNFMGAQIDENGNYYTDTKLRDIFEGEFLDPDNNVTYNVRKVLNLSREFYSFSNSQKPEGLLHVLLTLSNLSKGDMVMDFFAGNGATLATAHKIGAKFLGVEMGDHFGNFYTETIEYNSTEKNRKDIYEKFDVISVEDDGNKIRATVNKVGLVGRMKEVVACCGRHEPCGITENIEWSGGGFFKYYDLEQYEETLDRVKYSKDNDSIYTNDCFSQYIFFADKKMTDVLKNSKDSFDIDFDNLYKNIDLTETISQVYGDKIEWINDTEVKLKNTNKTIKYNVSEMNASEKIELAKTIKPLLWWGE